MRDNLFAMPEKSAHEIPRNWREQYEKGKMALTRQNWDYAVSLLGQVLQNEPGFYDCREALRAAQFKRAGSGTGFFKKAFGAVSNSPLLAKAQLAMRNNPLEALSVAEQILNNDPGNSTAHKLVAEASLGLDFPRTAILSLEILFKNAPQDRDVAMKLAATLVKAGFTQRAETLYSQLAQAFPDDQEVVQALKDFSASKTMQEGGYDALADGSGSYRDVIRDKEQAAKLEQEQRVVKSGEVADGLIEEYRARLEKEPDNLKLLRSLAELHAEKGEFDIALECYQRIAESGMGKDPSLEKAMADLQLRRYDQAIRQLDRQDPQQAEALAKLEADRRDFQISECRRRVESYPTDLQFRFELGELYFQAGRINEAIQELQKAVSNPHRRNQAMFLLGQCFFKKRMYDLAARTYEGALKEKLVFDEEKKELHYALGCALEMMGRKEDAVEQFKRIYETDIGFRDVAARVDAYYASNEPADGT